MTTSQTYGAYRLESSRPLSDTQLRLLAEFFNQPPKKTAAPLDGRSSVSFHQLDGIGPIVIKNYTRGGLVYRVVKRRYLKWGKTRGQREFELLQKVRKLGINAPEPVAQAYCGTLFYKAWLVTRAIHQPQSLARLSLLDEDKTRVALNSAVEQISLLIQHTILHVDLHPGNIIVDSTEKVYLLDFDRGQVYHGNRKKLRDRYLARWQRAVRKHGLPTFLIEMMQKRLK